MFVFDFENKPKSLSGRLLIDRYGEFLFSTNKYYKLVVLLALSYGFLQKMPYIMVCEMGLTKITPQHLQFLPN